MHSTSSSQSPAAYGAYKKSHPLFRRARSLSTSRLNLPEWDSSQSDLSKYKLSDEQMLRRKVGIVSPNNAFAAVDLRKRLGVSAEEAVMLNPSFDGHHTLSIVHSPSPSMKAARAEYSATLKKEEAADAAAAAAPGNAASGVPLSLWLSPTPSASSPSGLVSPYLAGGSGRVGSRQRGRTQPPPARTPATELLERYGRSGPSPLARGSLILGEGGEEEEDIGFSPAAAVGSSSEGIFSTTSSASSAAIESHHHQEGSHDNSFLTAASPALKMGLYEDAPSTTTTPTAVARLSQKAAKVPAYLAVAAARRMLYSRPPSVPSPTATASPATAVVKDNTLISSLRSASPAAAAARLASSPSSAHFFPSPPPVRNAFTATAAGVTVSHSTARPITVPDRLAALLLGASPIAAPPHSQGGGGSAVQVSSPSKASVNMARWAALPSPRSPSASSRGAGFVGMSPIASTDAAAAAAAATDASAKKRLLGGRGRDGSADKSFQIAFGRGRAVSRVEALSAAEILYSSTLADSLLPPTSVISSAIAVIPNSRKALPPSVAHLSTADACSAVVDEDDGIDGDGASEMQQLAVAAAAGGGARGARASVVPQDSLEGSSSLGGGDGMEADGGFNVSFSVTPVVDVEVKHHHEKGGSGGLPAMMESEIPALRPSSVAVPSTSSVTEGQGEVDTGVCPAAQLLAPLVKGSMGTSTLATASVDAASIEQTAPTAASTAPLLAAILAKYEERVANLLSTPSEFEDLRSILTIPTTSAEGSSSSASSAFPLLSTAEDSAAYSKSLQIAVTLTNTENAISPPVSSSAESAVSSAQVAVTGDGEDDDEEEEELRWQEPPPSAAAISSYLLRESLETIASASTAFGDEESDSKYAAMSLFQHSHAAASALATSTASRVHASSTSSSLPAPSLESPAEEIAVATSAEEYSTSSTEAAASSVPPPDANAHFMDRAELLAKARACLDRLRSRSTTNGTPTATISSRNSGRPVLVEEAPTIYAYVPRAGAGAGSSSSVGGGSNSSTATFQSTSYASPYYADENIAPPMRPAAAHPPLPPSSTAGASRLRWRGDAPPPQGSPRALMPITNAAQNLTRKEGNQQQYQRGEEEIFAGASTSDLFEDATPVPRTFRPSAFGSLPR